MSEFLLSRSRRPGSTFDAVRTGSLRRQCACGQHTLGGSSCEKCRSKSSSLFRSPSKSLGVVSPDTAEEKPSPRQGSATIQCNGAGGFEIVYGGWGGATCGTKDCVTAHESSHMADWQAKWPNGCTGQARGYLPKGDPPDNPLMTAAQYKAFLKDSECNAHTADLNCAQALPKSGNCKKTVDDYIKLTEDQKRHWCGGLSTAARIAISLGGAGAGALLGSALGGGAGAALGAGAGAFLGGVVGGQL